MSFIFCYILISLKNSKLSHLQHYYLIDGGMGVCRENLQPVASHGQTLSHNVVLSIPRHERDSNSQQPPTYLGNNYCM